MRIIGFGLILMTSFALHAETETRYVTDFINFHLLEAPSHDSKHVGAVPSGAEVTVLQSDGRFSEIETKDGKTGYIETRRLAEKPTAALRLKAMEEELKTLKNSTANPDALKKELQKKTTELNLMYQELESLRKISTSEEQATKENKKLKRDVEKLTHERDKLAQQLGAADGTSQIWWFLGGGFLLSLGLALGLILPRLNFEKRHNNHLDHLSGYG